MIKIATIKKQIVELNEYIRDCKNRNMYNFTLFLSQLNEHYKDILSKLLILRQNGNFNNSL